MSAQNPQVVEAFYALIRLLPRFDHQTSRRHLPRNGVYLFFEKGETVRYLDMITDRIVRIGTHRADGRFRSRIRLHYGNVRSLAGHKNASVFRKHLGGALLRKADPQDLRLRDWLTQGGPSFPEVEEMVSRVLRENFTFCCFRVDQRNERRSLERGLIALFSQYPLGQPSRSWLGRLAASEKIRRTGLWNTQHIDAELLTLKEFWRLEQLVKTTLVEAVT